LKQCANIFAAAWGEKGAALDWKNSSLFYIQRRVITVPGKIENIDLPPRDMRSQRKFLQLVVQKRVGQ
jgi:hypothetical protein